MYRRRNLLVMLVATVAALVCSANPALAGQPATRHIGEPPAKSRSSSVKTASNLQFAAATLGRENYLTPDLAQKTRLREDNAGFQGERIVFVWNGTNVPYTHDLDAACNAAQVSYGHKVLMFNLEPDRNHWPADGPALDAFNRTIDAIDAKVFWGSGSNGQSCWPSSSPPQQFMWMIGNEPNSHNFCNGNGTTNDLLAIHKVCAQREALLLHSSYAFIKGQNPQDSNGQQGKYGHLISVVGGGLSSHDAPIDLLTQYLLYRIVLGYKTCDMDYFGFHPYALNATALYSGFTLEPKVVAMLKAAGCPLKVIYTEMGVETIIPGGPGYNYDGKAQTGIAYVSEDQFASVYQQFIRIMQGQPDVIGFMNFELDDEQNLGGWQSGFDYFSGFPKPFVDVLRPIIAAIGDPPNAAPLVSDNSR